MWLMLHYNMKNKHGFLYLFCVITYVNSTLLYCSLIGKTFYIFFLPIIIVVILEYLDTRNLLIRLSTLILAVIVSNFFPSISEMQQRFGDRGEDIYVNAFNSLYINPLGWERCEIPDFRAALAKIYTQIDTNKENNFYIIENLHFQTKLSLEFPDNFFYSFSSIYRLDDLPSEQLLELVEQYRIHKENLFLHWINQNQIPFFLVGIRPFIKNIEITPPLSKLTESRDTDLRSFAKSLGTAYIQYLKTNHILNHRYDSIELPNQNPRLKVYILKSSGLEKPKQFPWNSHLQKVATDYEMEQTRPLPNWIKNLDEENQRRLLEKRAGTLYGELELESETLSFEKNTNDLEKS